MDYEGKYFPNEDEEEISKGKKLRKKIIRYFFYGIVALVYVVTFSILFTNCEPDLYKTVMFSEEANKLYEKAPEDFVVYRLFPQVFMNYDGSVQIDTVVYTPTAKELELGVKYNKKLDNNSGKPKFSIVDTNGNIYDIVSTVSEIKGRYVYSRIAFGNIKLNLEDNVYINPDNKSKTDGEGEAFDTLKFSFKIEYADGGEPELLDLFNSKTAVEITQFKN